MTNLNKVLLMGRLTRDPQISYLPSQTAVAEVGLAVNRKYKTHNGEMKEEANFFDCRAYGKIAETLKKNFEKGKAIFIEGRLKNDSWEDTEKKKHSKIRIIIEKYGFVDSVKKETVEAVTVPSDISECEMGSGDDFEL